MLYAERNEVSDEKTMIKDFEILKDGFTLMQIDYLGGSGSRGYGRVKIADLDLDVLIGDVSDETIDQCREILEG